LRFLNPQGIIKSTTPAKSSIVIKNKAPILAVGAFYFLSYRFWYVGIVKAVGVSVHRFGVYLRLIIF